MIHGASGGFEVLTIELLGGCKNISMCFSGFLGVSEGFWGEYEKFDGLKEFQGTSGVSGPFRRCDRFHEGCRGFQVASRVFKRAFQKLLGILRILKAIRRALWELKSRFRGFSGVSNGCMGVL